MHKKQSLQQQYETNSDVGYMDGECGYSSAGSGA